MNEKSETIKGRFRIDVIVISAILLVALLSLLLTLLLRKPGSVAVVEIDGAVAGEYPLSENGVFILNGGTNTLVIEGGEAYLENSDRKSVV